MLINHTTFVGKVRQVQLFLAYMWGKLWRQVESPPCGHAVTWGGLEILPTAQFNPRLVTLHHNPAGHSSESTPCLITAATACWSSMLLKIMLQVFGTKGTRNLTDFERLWLTDQLSYLQAFPTGQTLLFHPCQQSLPGASQYPPTEAPLLLFCLPCCVPFWAAPLREAEAVTTGTVAWMLHVLLE